MRNCLFSIQSNKLREHKGKDEYKVPDLPRTKFVSSFAELKLSISSPSRLKLLIDKLFVSDLKDWYLT